MLTPLTAENFRSYIARYRLKREEIGSLIGMNLNLLSMYTNEGRKMPGWAAHNIGYAINTLTGKNIFAVDMRLGVLPPMRNWEPGQTWGHAQNPVKI